FARLDMCCCSVSRRRPPYSVCFPYTTLFRSREQHRVRGAGTLRLPYAGVGLAFLGHRQVASERGDVEGDSRDHFEHRHPPVALRSEEHTSELQSRENLVCRLLLEKKKLYPNL